MKLINFFRICYCYFVLVLFAIFMMIVYFFSVIIFLFVDVGGFNKAIGDFSQEVERIVLNKVDELKRNRLKPHYKVEKS